MSNLSDVIEYFVPYKLTKASNPLAIAEREYASAPKIQFTTFTSCIGVIAKDGNTLTAVHLVMITAKEHTFNTSDAAKVLARLPKKADAVTIVGSIDMWESGNGDVLTAGFQKLASRLENVKKDYRGDGKYSASIVNGEIVVSSVW